MTDPFPLELCEEWSDWLVVPFSVISVSSKQDHAIISSYTFKQEKATLTLLDAKRGDNSLWQKTNKHENDGANLMKYGLIWVKMKSSF